MPPTKKLIKPFIPKHVLLISNEEESPKKKEEVVVVEEKRPPETHCKEFYESHDKDTKYVFAMMIGVSLKGDLDLNFSRFDAEHPPFSRRRRDFKPTLKVMQDEVIRRATNANVSRLPRPSQWHSEKILDALTNKFPPRLSKEDVAFLRLFHTIVELRSKFLVKKIHTRHTRESTFWKDAAAKFNDKLWVPRSVVIPSIEAFSQTMDLPFLFAAKLSDNHLGRIFGGIKHQLMTAVTQTNPCSSNPLWRVDGRVEQWDYEPYKVAAKLDRKPGETVVYLWELTNQRKMLGSCIAYVDDDTEGDLVHKRLVATETAAKAKASARQTGPVVMARQKELGNERFIECQELHLEQMKVYNRL